MWIRGRECRVGIVRNEEWRCGERATQSSVGSFGAGTGGHETLHRYGSAGEGEHRERRRSTCTVGQRDSGQHTVLKGKFDVGPLAAPARMRLRCRGFRWTRLRRAMAGGDLRCFGGKLQTEAGHRRSDAQDGGGEILDGFCLDTIPYHRPERAGCEDGDTGFVSGGRGRDGNILLRLYIGDGNARGGSIRRLMTATSAHGINNGGCLNLNKGHRCKI